MHLSTLITTHAETLCCEPLQLCERGEEECVNRGAVLLACSYGESNGEMIGVNRNHSL
jgi:hypothetical protein